MLNVAAHKRRDEARPEMMRVGICDDGQPAEIGLMAKAELNAWVAKSAQYDLDRESGDGRKQLMEWAKAR
jgi:hypothetical protein